MGANPVALHRCDHFVGRTTNWLYDHLRAIPFYKPIVLCDMLQHRDEFPELDTWCIGWNVTRRIWRRLTKKRLYPKELRRLQELGPRVLHSHFGSVARGDYTLQKVLNVPWVVGFYGADVYTRLPQGQPIYAPIFEKAKRLLALGPAMKARLEQLGCPTEKVVIHPLGVDVEHLPYKLRELKRGEPLKILFAGSYREKKGIQYVIEAAARVRRAGVRFELHLVGDVSAKPGDSETQETVFRLIRHHNLEDVITKRPYIPFRELIALALRSHVFVAPSVTAADGDAEGTPFVLQQMMATGMPVIATVHTDIPFVFGEHAHLLVPERDAGSIADRLQYYVDDPDALIAQGTALRDRIRCAFDIRTCAARLSDVYDACQ